METVTLTFHRFSENNGGPENSHGKRGPWGSGESKGLPGCVDKIMKDLDQCRDDKVGFQSFLSVAPGLIIACNDYFVVHMEQKGKK